MKTKNCFEYFFTASEMNTNNCQDTNIILRFPFEERNYGYFYCVGYNLQYPFEFVSHRVEWTPMVDSKCTFHQVTLDF